MYYVRRSGRIRGPLTLEKLRSLRDEDRLRIRDEISESADGPWSLLADMYEELLGESTAEHTALDDEFLATTPSSRPTARQPVRAGDRGSPGPHKLLRKPVQLWIVIASGVALACLLVLATALGVVLSPLVSAPTDQEEAADEAPRTARPRVAPSGPTRPGSSKPAVAQQASTRPAAEQGAAGPDSAAAPAAAATQPAPSREPAAAPAPADSDPPPPPADEAAIDHEADIKATLAAYYSAGGWRERYRTALPGEDVQKLMRAMYDDVDWVSVQWSITRMPKPEELKAAAKAGERVRIDAVTNGNPHSIYVAFSEGHWRIDWLQSLNSLWLSK